MGFRIHLSTVLIFIFCFGALVWFTVFRPVDRPGWRTEGVAYGWPMLLVVNGKGSLPDGTPFSYHLYRAGVKALHPEVSRYFFGCLTVNLSVAIILSLMIARYFECRARRKDPQPPVLEDEELIE